LKLWQGDFVTRLAEARQHLNKGKDMKANRKVKARLEYLREEIKAERISYEEISELQGLAEFIEPDDVLLLEWAGVPEVRR